MRLAMLGDTFVEGPLSHGRQRSTGWEGRSFTRSISVHASSMSKTPFPHKSCRWRLVDLIGRHELCSCDCEWFLVLRISNEEADRRKDQAYTPLRNNGRTDVRTPHRCTSPRVKRACSSCASFWPVPGLLKGTIALYLQYLLCKGRAGMMDPSRLDFVRKHRLRQSGAQEPAVRPGEIR